MEFSTETTTSGRERHSFDCIVTINLAQPLGRLRRPAHLDLRIREHTAAWLASESNAIRNWGLETWPKPGSKAGTRSCPANRSKIRLNVFLRAVRLNSTNTRFSVLRGVCRYANATLRNATLRNEHSSLRCTDVYRRTLNATNSDAGVPAVTDSPNRDTLRLNAYKGDADNRRLRNTLVTHRPPSHDGLAMRSANEEK